MFIYLLENEQNGTIVYLSLYSYRIYKKIIKNRR